MSRHVLQVRRLERLERRNPRALPWMSAVGRMFEEIPKQPREQLLARYAWIRSFEVRLPFNYPDAWVPPAWWTGKPPSLECCGWNAGDIYSWESLVLARHLGPHARRNIFDAEAPRSA